MEQSAPVTWVGDAVTWETAPTAGGGQQVTIRTRKDTYQAHLPLLGEFQAVNAAVAVAAVEAMADSGHSIDRRAVVDGLAAVEWPGRLEVLARQPTVVADGAHNDHSVATLLDTLPAYLPHDRLTVVAGFSRDKQVDAMVELLAARAHRVIATRSRHPRSMRPDDIAERFRTAGVPAARVAVVGGVADAVNGAKSEAGAGELILVTGSLFVVAEAREALLGIAPETYPDLLPPDLR